ncbi:hypothetical protein TCON_1822 [Astathelohania contejeani]|uniref:USP domain-containing protein n=1 Tax=Astathelohania contejeani TaxID=164912 RepID=A0ABQ7HXR7_9MICR|nr:hypothetical protein TCON_1822 [Thelohania contejeani]
MEYSLYINMFIQCLYGNAVENINNLSKLENYKIKIDSNKDKYIYFEKSHSYSKDYYNNQNIEKRADMKQPDRIKYAISENISKSNSKQQSKSFSQNISKDLRKRKYDYDSSIKTKRNKHDDHQMNIEKNPYRIDYIDKFIQKEENTYELHSTKKKLSFLNYLNFDHYNIINTNKYFIDESNDDKLDDIDYIKNRYINFIINNIPIPVKRTIYGGVDTCYFSASINFLLCIKEFVYFFLSNDFSFNQSLCIALKELFIVILVNKNKTQEKLYNQIYNIFKEKLFENQDRFVSNSRIFIGCIFSIVELELRDTNHHYFLNDLLKSKVHTDNNLKHYNKEYENFIVYVKSFDKFKYNGICDAILPNIYDSSFFTSPYFYNLTIVKEFLIVEFKKKCVTNINDILEVNIMGFKYKCVAYIEIGILMDLNNGHTWCVCKYKNRWIDNDNQIDNYGRKPDIKEGTRYVQIALYKKSNNQIFKDNIDS